MKRLLLLMILLLPRPLPGGEHSSLPRIPGWTLTPDSARYDPTNLWDLIDGAAEAFLSYGFRELVVGEYLGPDSVRVRAELYQHSAPVMAFGIYTSERAPEYGYVEIGTEGYLEEGVLNFLAGSYYCKLTTDASGGRGRQALLAVARGVDHALREKKEWPAGLSLLPSAGRSLRSEGFVAESVLGFPFLRGAYTAEYGSGVRLFAIPCATPDSVGALARRYAAVAPGKELRRRWWRIEDPNNGLIFLLLRGSTLYAISGASESAAERLARRIR